MHEETHKYITWPGSSNDSEEVKASMYDILIACYSDKRNGITGVRIAIHNTA